MIMRFSSSPTFPRLFSAGFVFSSVLLSPPSSPWSADGFAPHSERRKMLVAVRRLCGGHHPNKRWMSGDTLPSSESIESSPSATLPGVCYDESVLVLLERFQVENIDFLVQQRSRARWEGNYTLADDLKGQIVGFSGIPAGYEMVLQDIPRSSGGGSRWSLVHTIEIYDKEFSSGQTILQLAHAAMGLAVDDNQQKRTEGKQRYRKESLEALVDKAKDRLGILIEETKKMDSISSVFEVSTKNTMVQSELGGRTASDAAFWFALAGSRDGDLFHDLADIASWELNRFGQRPSFRSKYILQIVERFAAAGLKQHDKLERIARVCLLKKAEEEEQAEVESGMSRSKCGSEGDEEDNITNIDTENFLNLHSDRSLLLIWKFATKQKKQRTFLRSAMKSWEEYHEAECDDESPVETASIDSYNEENRINKEQDIITPSYDWDKIFEDVSRPLVVDVGCGMGVSLLGLASTTDQLPSTKESSRLMLGETTEWSDCNFVGVDLGALGIEYGRGVAHRWGLEGSLHFAIDAAEDFCQQLELYPGEIRCCMIQFPT